MLMHIARFILSGFLFICVVAIAGDLQCYSYTSTTSQFPCGTYGNCTWWAAYKRPDLATAGIHGDAVNWYGSASGLGFQVGSVPKVGAVAVFSNGPNGHVAYVESLEGNQSFKVSEMDWYKSTGFVAGVNSATYYRGSGNTYHRNTDKGTSVQGSWILKGFIYQKESCNPSKERCTLKVNGPIGWYPPVNDCTQASQWFNIAMVNGEKVAVGSTTKSACPLVCYAN